MGRLGWALLALGIGACVVRGANRPADPFLDSAPSTSDRRPLEGFDETAFRIVSASGAMDDGCALLADTLETRGQGLMEQQDLRGYDAMVFVFQEPSTGGFYMRKTRIPLSIAWFEADGTHVGQTDMVPCPDEVADCPTYDPGAPYSTAMEVAEGGLDDLGVGPGATLTLVGGCTA